VAVAAQEFSDPNCLHGTVSDRRGQGAGVATVHNLADGADGTGQTKSHGHRLRQLLRTSRGHVSVNTPPPHSPGQVGDLGNKESV